MNKSNNVWINFGKIVDQQLRDGEEKPRKALQTGFNVEVTVKQTNADGSFVTRVFPPKSFFNITEEIASINQKFAKNPERLEKELANRKKYPFVKYDVSAGPSKDTQITKYDNNLDELDLE